MSGKTKTTKLGVLLGSELHEIYAPPQTGQTAPKYLQVFPKGDAMVELADGSVIRGDGGPTAKLSTSLATRWPYAVPVSELESVKGVPAGAEFGARLMQELSSRSTHQGDVVKAVSITPVVVDGEILVPREQRLRARWCRQMQLGGGSSMRRPR